MLHAPTTMRPADRITPKDDNAETPEEFVQKLPSDCKRQCALACVLFFAPCHPFRPGSGFTLRGAQWVMRNPSAPSCAGVEVPALIGADSLMHPTLHPAPFTAAGWAFENKFDGFRALVRKSGDKAELISRRGRSLARAFPGVVQAIATLPHDAVLDAELVVSDPARIERVERVGNLYA